MIRRSNFIFLLVFTGTILVTRSSVADPVSNRSEDQRIGPDREISLVEPRPHIPSWKSAWDAARKQAEAGQLEAAAAGYAVLLASKPNIEQAVWEYCKVQQQLGDLDGAWSSVSLLLEKKPNHDEYLLAAADIAASREESERALKYYGRLLQKNPLGPFADMAIERMAESMLRLGRKDAAYPLLEELVSRGDVTPQLLDKLFETAFALGMKARARHWFGMLWQQGTLTDKRILQGIELYDDSEKQVFRRQLAELYLKKHPDDIPLREMVARSYRHTGNYQKSLEQFETLIRKGGDKDSYRLAAAELCLKYLNRPDRALNLYEQYLASHPKDKDILSKIGELRMVLANDLLSIVENSGAWLLWRDLAHIAPNRIEIYKNMADLLEEKGKDEPLAEILEILVEQNPHDYPTILRLARLYRDQGKTGEAWVLLEKIPQEYRRHSDSVLNLEKDLSLALGKEHEAFGVLGWLLESATEKSDILQEYIVLGGRLGALEQVIEAYRSYGAIGEKNEAGSRVLRVYIDALAQNHLYSLALQELMDAEARYETGDQEWIELKLVEADLLHRQGKPVKAEQLLRQLLNMVVPSEKIFFRLASLAIERRAYREAQDWINSVKAVCREELDQSDSLLHISAGTTRAVDLELRLLEIQLLKGQGKYQQALDVVKYIEFPTKLRVDDPRWDIVLRLRRQECWLLFYTGRREDAVKRASRILQSRFDPELEAMLNLLDSATDTAQQVRLNERLAPHGHSPIGRLLDFAEKLVEFKEHTRARQLVDLVLERFSGSVRALVLKLEIAQNTGDFTTAEEIVQLTSNRFPGERSFLETLIEVALRQGEFERALRLMMVLEGVDDKVALSKKYSSSGELSAILRYARVLWGLREMRQALQLYRVLLEPPVLEVLLKQFEDKNVGYVIPGKDGGLWNSMVMLLSSSPELVDELMAPRFLLNNLGTETGQIVSAQYSRYRIQKLAGREYVARKAIYEKNYYFAEQSYRQLPDEQQNVSTMLDLATIYGRIGKVRKEAQIYREIESTGATSPKLQKSMEQSALQLSPRSTFDMEFRSRKGREGSIDSEKLGLGTTFLFTPALDKDFSILYENARFGSQDDSQVAWSNRVMGEGLFEFGDSYELKGRLQLEKTNVTGGGEPVYTIELRGQLDDYVAGFVALEKHLVYDTVEAIKGEISAQGFSTGLEVETSFGVLFGGDVDFYRFSDDNSRNRFHAYGAYRVFSDFSEWTLQYDYRYQANDREVTTEAGAPVERPAYWSPASFYDHLFSVVFDHDLADLYSGGGNSTLRLMTGVGVEKGGVFTSRGAIDIFLEISPHYLLKGNFVVSRSDEFEETGGTLSLQYRW